MTQAPVSELARLGVALLVGLLIGLDRERAEERKKRAEFAGIRTFPLIALAGCVPMLLLDSVGPWLVVASFLAVAALVVVAYRKQAQEDHVGATTEAAALAAFLLGALAGDGRLLLAASSGIVVAVLLVAKPRLEGFSKAITAEELSAALELAVISVIVLPLLPNRGYGPWQALNPRDVWMVVVLVAGLSFAGFIAVRLVGEERGLAVTGAIGGLVSSTAVTVAMADRSKESEGISRPAAAAAVLASAVMAARIGVLAGVVNRAILPRVLPVAIVMALVGAVAARILARRGRRDVVEAGERIRNPFSLRQAVLFGTIFALIVLGVRAANEYLGQGGAFVAAALGSVADVDAATIAFARMDAGEPAWRTAAAAIAVAAVTNTLVKLGLGMRGAPSFRRDIALALGVMAAAGAAAGIVVYFS